MLPLARALGPESSTSAVDGLRATVGGRGGWREMSGRQGWFRPAVLAYLSQASAYGVSRRPNLLRVVRTAHGPAPTGVPRRPARDRLAERMKRSAILMWR